VAWHNKYKPYGGEKSREALDRYTTRCSADADNALDANEAVPNK